MTMTMRLTWLVWLGRAARLVGYPCVVREGHYESAATGVSVSVRALDLFTVVTVNGVDVYFYRLTGGIDGVGVGPSSCRAK